MLFAYDNDRFILRSDLPYDESVSILCDDNVKAIRLIGPERVLPVVGGRADVRLVPNVNYLFEVITE